MARLVGAHRFDHGAGAPVGGRQRVEVARQVLLDLPLGLGEEGKVPAVAERAGDGDIKVKNYAVALAVPVGPGSIRASYAISKDIEGPLTNAANQATSSVDNGTRISDTGVKQYNIGYEHRFSKRTNIGIGYAKIDNKANAAMAWTGMPPNQQGSANTTLYGSDVSTFFVSMTHRF